MAIGPERILRIAVAALAIGVPVAGWIWVPDSLPAAIVLRTIAILAAFHGLGRFAASLARDDQAPFGLTLVWGLAIYLALAGALLAVDAFGPGGRTAVIVVGCVLGAGWLAHHALDLARVAPRSAAVALVGVAIATIFVLGAGGHWHGPFLDADLEYLGALRRLADTGGLGDAVGFPRAAGLGGQVALAALVDTVDLRAAHLVDRGVLFVVTLVLVATTVRRVHGVGFALLALPFLVLAIPQAPDDMAPRWSLVVLVLGSALSLERFHERRVAGNALLLVLTAAATATLRHAGAVFALMMIAWVVRGDRERPRAVPLWSIIAVASAVTLPYLISMARAWSGLADPTLIDQYAWRAAQRILILVGIGGLGALVVAAALPRTGFYRSVRLTLFAACLSVAVAGVVSPTMTAEWQYALPIGIATVLLICIAAIGEPAEDAERPPPAVGVLATLAVVAALALGRFPAGGLPSWQLRFGAVLHDVRALGSVPRSGSGQLAGDYAAAQSEVPPGARLGIWVERPDLVDHAAHEIIDLRAATTRTCKPGCDRLARLLTAVDIQYVLVSSDATPVSFAPTSFAHGSVTVVDLGAR